MVGRDFGGFAVAALVTVLSASMFQVALSRTDAPSIVGHPAMSVRQPERPLPTGLQAAIAHRLGGVGLRQSFADDGGLHVSEATNAATNWSLVPVSIGRSGASPSIVHPAAPVTTSGRTSFAMGAMTSWYRSSTAGIEQGFDIARRPSGSRHSFAITLRSGGSLTPLLSGDHSLSLVSRSGRTVLGYGGLHVTDATGRVVSSRLSVSGHRVRILVDDQSAVYPLVVDPFAQQLEVTGSDSTTGDSFGTSVALSADGKVAAVGAAGRQVNTGAVYMFTGPNWGTQTVLTANDGLQHDSFGTSLALSADGSILLVGVPYKTIGSNLGIGEAYVFSGTNWGTETNLTAPDGAQFDNFGTSVALSSDGTIAMVGAPQHQVGSNAQQGSAYVFKGTNWATESELTLPSSGPNAGASGDNFGYSVALSSSGSTALVGADNRQVGSNPFQGAAFVFTGTNFGTLSRLTASGGTANDNFGSSVALSSSGAVALVGAPSHTIGSNASQGEAYVFSGTNYGTQTDLVASDGGFNSLLGYSVALSGSGATAYVGAVDQAMGSILNVGATYIFNGTSWGSVTELTAADGVSGDQLGNTVALSADGTVALAGAVNHAVGSNAGQGAAYFFATANPASSFISASPTSIPDNGTSTSSITVQANDSAGNNMTTGGDTVVLATTAGTLGPVTDNGNGTYTATLTSATSPGTASITGTMDGTAIGGSASVDFVALLPPVTGAPTVTGAGIDFPWSPVAGATSYTVIVYVNGVAQAPVTGLTGLSYILANPVAGASYSFAVMAVNGTTISPASARSTSVTVPPASAGYWTVAGDGGVFSFGPNFYGSTGNLELNQPVFAITSTADGKGYWFVARDGGVFAYGDGVFHGSVPALGVHVTNIVGMAADTATGGYWLVGSDGGVYAFNAPFKGSVPELGQHVTNIVGVAATADGGGYYLVSSTGSVYAFGDAKYQGGANTLPRINAPIVGLSFDSATGGYWEAGSDGGIYAYGAPFHGSAGGASLSKPVVGISATTDGSGYYLVASDGGVFSSNTLFLGSMAGTHLNAPMVGITVAG